MPGVMLQREGASRDVLLLDIALDSYFRLCLERTDKVALGGDDLCELIALVLRNTVIAYDCEDFKQVQCCEGPGIARLASKLSAVPSPAVMDILPHSPRIVCLRCASVLCWFTPEDGDTEHAAPCTVLC